MRGAFELEQMTRIVDDVRRTRAFREFLGGEPRLFALRNGGLDRACQLFCMSTVLRGVKRQSHSQS